MTTTDDAPPPPSGRHRQPKSGTLAQIKVSVKRWVLEAIDEAALADGISRSGWVARELERIVTKKEKPRE
ncbi:MAG TPA: hypothetical protein VKY73_05795 [Polyangiaceae bacterium]|nr:hypothetical protein [Polyangiaceae bacterium]